MSSNPRTRDGQEMTAGISGFTKYSTTRVDAPTRPAPVMSPDDILAEIRRLKKFMSLPELDSTLKTLTNHIANQENPHGVTLDQFTQDICDVLYEEFKAAGGNGTKEFYLQSLFQTLRIASLTEMKTSDNTSLVVSARGARQFFREHEADTNAHETFFKQLMPGTPIEDDPLYADYAEFGSNLEVEELEVPDGTTALIATNNKFSFIGSDRFIHYVNDCRTLGSDWSFPTAPGIACFGQRTNEIINSNGFLNLTECTNCSINAIETCAPDRTTVAYAVNSETDTEAVEHIVAIPDLTLPIGVEKTFSVFAKAEQCRYLAITYKDFTTSQIVVAAIYDLKSGVVLTLNHLNRYRAEIFTLNCGWFRCCFTMYHELGQQADLKMIFFNKSSDQSDYSIKASEGTLGYLWGMQLEVGPNASPYLPTTNGAVVRPGIRYKLRLTDPNWDPNKYTIKVAYVNPKTSCVTYLARPIFEVVDEYGLEAISATAKQDGKVEVLVCTTLTVGNNRVASPYYQTIFAGNNDAVEQLIHAADSEQFYTRFNSELGMNLQAPLQQCTGKTLYLGCDSDGNSLDGWIRHLVIYDRRVTEDEAIFLNGDDIRG